MTETVKTDFLNAVNKSAESVVVDDPLKQTTTN